MIDNTASREFMSLSQPQGEVKMNYQDAIELLQRSSDAGTGADEREFLMRAIVELTNEFADQHWDAGNCFENAMGIIADAVEASNIAEDGVHCRRS